MNEGIEPGTRTAYAYCVRVLRTRTGYAYCVRVLRTRTAYAYCVRVRVRVRALEIGQREEEGEEEGEETKTSGTYAEILQ